MAGIWNPSGLLADAMQHELLQWGVGRRRDRSASLCMNHIVVEAMRQSCVNKNPPGLCSCKSRNCHDCARNLADCGGARQLLP